MPARCCFLALMATSNLFAQATDASIAGRVTDQVGSPLVGATVTAVHQPTGRRFSILTGPTGRFSIFQLPVGGPYRIEARRIGYQPVTEGVGSLSQGDRRVVLLLMRDAVRDLGEVMVLADPRQERIGGSVAVDSTRIRSLPIANRNFSDLAALSPWAGPQLSLGGQRWTGTEYRLDGVRSRNALRAGEYNAGPFGPPLEGIREFEVNTNVYDVTQGRQGGGEVAALTQSGTNQWRGSVFSSYRSDALGAGQDYQGRPRSARPFTTIQWGGSIGGALVRDRAHVFVAAERQDGSVPLLVGLLDTDQAEVAAGIARDSLARIVSVLSTAYGTPSPASQLGRLPRDPAATSLLVRADWSLSPRHLLTVRHVVSLWNSPLSGGVDQPITLREARSDFRSNEHQALASLRSTLSATTENEIRIGFSASRRKLTPVSPGVPRGFVQVRSALPDGTIGNTTVQFGGNRLAPDDSREWTMQLTDVVNHAIGPVELTAGTDNAVTRFRTLIAEAQTGLFVFPSIGALANRQPNRFTRTVPLSGAAPVSDLTLAELAAFAQAVWRPGRFAVMAGLRWDGTAQLSTPAANPVAESALGLRTDRRAEDWFTVSPRAQLNWDPRGDGSRLVRIGGGLFSGSLPGYAYHNQLLNTGLTVSDVDLRGAAVPAPDFPAYRADPRTIPGVPAGTTVPPYLNLVGSSYQAPLTWKASASYRHRLSPAISLTGTVTGSWSRAQFHYIDRNLRPTPAFLLDAEGGRGVYVPAATIGANGLTDVRNAFVNPAVGRVLSLESIGRAAGYGASVEVAIRPASGRYQFDLAYAHLDARDNSTYGCCLARTAAAFTPVATDPRDLTTAWAPSDLSFRHRLVGSGGGRLGLGVTATGRLVVTSGRRYSLTVDGDLNGDEVNGNDLAFLFDPNSPSTPTDVGAAIDRILANPDNFAAGYIRAHLGQIAGRNGLTTPGTVRLDLRLAKPIAIGRRTRATLTVDLFNALNAIDGDWGAERLLPLGISNQNPIVNRVPLLRIVGFDQATRRFRYTVNEQAGVLPRGGDPFQFQVGLRFDR